MRTLTYRIHLAPAPQGGYFVTVPALQDCATWGRDYEHAIGKARIAIELHLTQLAAGGDAIPEDSLPADALVQVQAPAKLSASQDSSDGQMSSTAPKPISDEEWREIFALPKVQELWGLNGDDIEFFLTGVYGVKFDFTSGGPGYSGDLYILQGDMLTGDPPVVLTRNYAGKLEVENQHWHEP